MRRLWTEIDGVLIGRKQLLERKIKPALSHPTRRFILVGDAEAGKSALLEAAHDLCASSQKCLIHGGAAHRDVCLQIVSAWDLSVETTGSGKPTARDYAAAILGSSGNVLFIDDLHRLTQKRIDFFKAVATRNKVCGSLLKGGIKEPLRPLLAHMGDEIKVPRLSHHDTFRMAEKVCRHLASPLTPAEVATAARGLPGRVVTFAAAGYVQKTEIRSRDEEIDVSPLILICLAVLLIFRVVGRALHETDLLVLGGAALVLFLIFRIFFSRGKER